MYYGDLGKRVLASIIDSFIVGIIAFVLGVGLGVLGLGLIAIIISPIISWLYFILMEGGSSHATVGKKAMGLYVAYGDGTGITYSTAVLRLIGKVLSGAIFCIGYLMGFFNDQKQCLHDMIAKTYVLSGEAVNNNSCSNRGYVNQNVGGRELVAINGPLAGMIYQVGEKGLIIGRDSISCQVVVPASQEKVSRIHCFVTFNAMSGMFVVNDRNSTHGTFLADGRRISYSQPMALRSGDRFYLATPENTFEVR